MKRRRPAIVPEKTAAREAPQSGHAPLCQVSRALSLELCRTLSKQARVVGDEGGGLELVGKLPHAKGTIIAGP
eukprot:scaffold267_cov131-Isochrysis_galbana.AAC.1